MSEPRLPANADPQATVAPLAAALTARSLYPGVHPRVAAAIGAAVGALRAFLDASGTDEVSILRVGDDLAVAGQALRGGGIVVRGFRNSLERHGIEGLTVRRGLDVAELGEFLGDLCEGRGAKSTLHLQVGQVSATIGGGPESEQAPPELDETAARALADLPSRNALTPEALAAAREALEAAGNGTGKARVDAFERLASQALAALALATEMILPLTPIAGEEDELFQHSLRVCFLTLGLGRALGFHGDPLRDLGIAAFLHDVGKLALPAEVRRTRGRLDDATWRLQQLHPELGAARLSGVEGAPAVAILVAYEHHWRADGAPSFPAMRTPRRPGLASQMVAVADAYDVFASAVADQGDAGRVAALTMLAQRGAQGALNAELVGRLAKMLPAQPA